MVTLQWINLAVTTLIIKVSITHNKTNGHHVFPGVMDSQVHSFTLCHAYQKYKTESNEEMSDKPKFKEYINRTRLYHITKTQKHLKT